MFYCVKYQLSNATMVHFWMIHRMLIRSQPHTNLVSEPVSWSSRRPRCWPQRSCCCCWALLYLSHCNCWTPDNSSPSSPWLPKQHHYYVVNVKILSSFVQNVPNIIGIRAVTGTDISSWLLVCEKLPQIEISKIYLSQVRTQSHIPCIMQTTWLSGENFLWSNSLKYWFLKPW